MWKRQERVSNLMFWIGTVCIMMTVFGVPIALGQYYASDAFGIFAGVILVAIAGVSFVLSKKYYKQSRLSYWRSPDSDEEH
jgi:hypothetical protein